MANIKALSCGRELFFYCCTQNGYSTPVGKGQEHREPEFILALRNSGANWSSVYKQINLTCNISRRILLFSIHIKIITKEGAQMISIGANRNRKAYGIKHYNLDTESELSKINVNREVMGTTAFVIETSQRYMLNGSKEWKKINTGNGGGSGGNDFVYDGGGVENDENIYDGGGVGNGSDDNIYEGGGV